MKMKKFWYDDDVNVNNDDDMKDGDGNDVDDGAMNRDER